jgi:hypothetical protein
MDPFQHPPWNATDETIAHDPAPFKDCEQALQAFVTRGKGKVVDQKYSVSQTWGRVLRARVCFGGAGMAGMTDVTCWTGDSPGVRMAVEIEQCGPQQAGC